MQVHDGDHAAREGGRANRIIWLMLAASFVVVLNETILSVALPHLMRDFSIDSTTAQWVSSAFLLTMAIVVPTTGYLIERFNTRTLFVAAMALFTVGTALAVIAVGFPMLLAARVVQAAGTAVMLPLLIATALTIVPFDQRGRIIGRISIVIAVAPAAGPTLSGIVLTDLGWRWLFVFVLPFAIAALLLGILRVPNIGAPVRTRLDVMSVVLCAAGFGGLIYGLSSLGSIAATGLLTWTSLGVGLACVSAFILRQVVLQRTDAALLDLRTFESLAFSMSIVTVSIATLIMFGTLILLPIYTQGVLGLSPTQTGLLLLPGGVLSGVLAPLVGHLYDRRGPTALLVSGAVVLSLALFSLAGLDAHSPPWRVLVGHSLASVGLAFVFTPLLTAGLAALRPGLYPHGSAIMATVQQVAAAMGIAIYVSILSLTQLRLGSVGAEATASGVHAAFLLGALGSILVIPSAALIRRPPATIGLGGAVRLH